MKPSSSSGNTDIEHILSEKQLVYEDGEQQVYVLPENDISTLMLSFSAVDRVMGFSQSKTWSPSEQNTEKASQDEILKAIALRLKTVTGEDSCPSMPGQSGAEQSLSEEKFTDKTHNEEIFVLPNSAEVERLVKNLSGSTATGFSQSRFWRQISTADSGKIEIMLQEILNRIVRIEEQLKRMEEFYTKTG